MTNRTLKNLFSPSFLVVHSTLAFGTGIALALPAFPYSPRYSALALATVGFGMACFFALRLSRKLGHTLTIVFFLLIGFSHGISALAPPWANHHIANLVSTQKEVILIGVVAKAPRYSRDRTTLIIDSRGIYIPPADHLPVLRANLPLPTFQKASGLVKINMRGRPKNPLFAGDQILTRAKLSPPQGFHNPGGFDHSRFLATQNIFISGWISSGQSIIKVDGLTRKDSRLFYGPEQLRSQLISFLDHNLPEKHSALYRALITGDRGGLSPELTELFRSLGIVHLLAISGLHMALLAGAVMTGSYWLLQRSSTILLHGSAKKIAACAAILPLILYCLVAGFQTPALRALLMIMVFISALLSDRQWHGPTNISLAALFILIINPLAITTVSFQLSFAAVAGIILILPQARDFFTTHEHKNIKRLIIRYASGSLIVSLAASLATLPLLLYHFNRFALSGPLATITIEPFLCMWALGWGLPASLLAPLFPNLALLLFKTGGAGLDIALYLAEKLQPLSKSIWLPTPSVFQVILFYSGLFSFIQIKKTQLRMVAVVCCLMIFAVAPSKITADQATILDVGQGNCTLIETSEGEVIVVDAGGPRSPSFDIGRQVIAPALWSKGIRSIDLLILSHPDQDHYSGAAFLLEHFTPRDLWIPTKNAPDPGWQKMLEIAKRVQSNIHIPKKGETYSLASGSTLSCLGDLHSSAQEKQNNQSLVIKFTSAKHSLLMPGDIENEAERYLVDHHDNLSSDVIIAPHHGSISSSSREFLNKVAPKTVIFSASRFKRSRYPNRAVEKRYREGGATSLLTSEAGAITILFMPEGLETSSLQ
ncbi:MAG: DNA internalization-related competence protein ComEC/Rec2 [Thermodesulfobacteriota bacterium]